jgi:hypothetical protein
VRPSSASSWRSRPSATLSRWRRIKSRVSHCLTLALLVFLLEGSHPPF